MWCHTYLVLLSIQPCFYCGFGATLRRPQRKQPTSDSKESKVHGYNPLPYRKRATQDPQCVKDAKEKYGREAVAIEKCAEAKDFKKKLAEALKSDDRHEASDICEDVLMNCVGLSMACAKQQIPLMLDRAHQKQAEGQLETSRRHGQIAKDRSESDPSDSNSDLRAPDDPDVDAGSATRPSRRPTKKSYSQSEARHSTADLGKAAEHSKGDAAQHQQPQSSYQATLEDSSGMLELCHRNGLRVVLDTKSNSRRMTFGDNAWEKLIQTAVNCRGAPAPTCRAPTGSNGCDLSPSRCPCEFQMQKLPPLDHEYIYIADQVLQKEEQSLESMMGSSSIRGPRTEGEHTGLQMALVGLGGGMIAQYLISHSTQLSIDAIEVNADVVAAARAFFGVTRAEKHGRLRVLQGDGLSTLGESSPAMYGVVVVDCFGGSAGRMPESCRSQAFAEAVYRAMKPGGEMLQNVLISRSDDATLDKEVRRDFEELLTAYRKVFGAYAVDLQSKWEHGDNAVVRARKIGSVKEVSLLTSLLEPSE